MEKSTIIKLRQSEANEVDENGSFRVNLTNGITLEEGDEVRVHSVILDTATESVISLPEPVDVVMGVAKYNRNFMAGSKLDPTQFDGAINYVPDPLPYQLPDLKNEIACVRHTMPGNCFEIGWIVLQLTQDREVPVFTTHWQYQQPVTGETKIYPITIGPYKARDHLSKNILVPLGPGGWITGNKSFKNIDSQKTLRKHGLRPFLEEQQVPGQQGGAGEKDIDLFGNGGYVWANNGQPIATSEKLLTIFEEDCTFTIPAGVYEPPEIAQIVNDNMTKIDSLGSIGNNFASKIYPVNNPFLAPITQIQDKVSKLTDTPDLVFIPETLSGVGASVPASILLPPGSSGQSAPTSLAEDRYIGASQISMNYDENLNKLNFDALHMPCFVGTIKADGTLDPVLGTATPGVAFPTFATDGTTALPAEPQVSNGGAFFTKLQPTEFWRTLGFNDILVAPTYDNDVITLSDGDEVRPLIFNLELGKNIVGALPSVDIVTQKSSGFYALSPIIQDTINSFTTPILASRRFNEVLNDEGYYLLEIGFKLPQEMIGGHLNNNSQTGSNRVQSIITKYFTSGNFLQDTGTGSVVYTHRGEPQMLNDFDVKIVHPDFSVPLNDELGDKNSIFLEVIKAVKPQFAPPSQTK